MKLKKIVKESDGKPNSDFKSLDQATWEIGRRPDGKKQMSPVSNLRVMIVRPEKEGAIVTLADQKRLGRLIRWPKARFVPIHFFAHERESVKEMICSARLSKPMVVTEISALQWYRRYMDAETIPETGIHATAKQLKDSFKVEG